uniref:Chi-conotoxin-like 1 n=1 Tax=Conus textile TaxID=6494 RepID=CTAB_CONTE|nr:RecName: Full=Chi-conotoxin-like 1; AltName: Full=Tx10b [Conus textile]
DPCCGYRMCVPC